MNRLGESAFSPEIRESELFQPIPLEITPLDGWKEIPVLESGEELVPIGPFAGNNYDRFFTSSIYFGEREDSPYQRDTLNGALLTTFVRSSVAEQLMKAEKVLPKNHHIIILDTYRSLDVQQSLYDQYYVSLKKQKPSWTDEELSAETQKYVSLPSGEPSKPSPHNTGGSVDLAIYSLFPEVQGRITEINDEILSTGNNESSWERVYMLEMERIRLISINAKLLNFGTKFDWGGNESALNYFELLATTKDLTEDEREAMKNRRVLYNAMMQAGFMPYADEWWHYNSSKSQMGARYAGLPFAEFGPMVLSPQNLAHERTRREHLRGTEFLKNYRLQTNQRSQYYSVAKIAAEDFGDMTSTNLPKAEKISPPEK